jgi:hypothetical protein
MILRRNSIKKTRKSRVFRVEFRVSKLEKSSFSSRVSSLSFKNSNLTRNSAFFEFHCMFSVNSTSLRLVQVIYTHELQVQFMKPL